MQSTEGLRQRRGAASGASASVAETPATSPQRTAAKPATNPAVIRATGSSTVLACILLIVGGTAAAVNFRRGRAAAASADMSAIAPTALFSVPAAMQHVSTIERKPRWIGSLALDQSLEYVHIQLTDLIDVAERNGMLLEVESFTANGSFASSTVSSEIVVSYNQVLSVVARLSPVVSASSDKYPGSLLVNSHIDSAMGSRGASDDVVGVAVAMESLRCLASTPHNVNSLARPLVFLFNGAEEPLLAGADGFIKAHRWANGVAAVINLESIGSGDGYMLFQLGPRNSWLARAYATAVRHPLASVAGSEIFELGLIPGETDFRIFKAAGIPGYDFAFIQNGHVYHTIYDDANHVSLAALEYGGKTLLLPLVMQLAGSTTDAIGEHLAATAHAEPTLNLPFYIRLARILPSFRSIFYSAESFDKGSDPRVAYFDYLGAFTVVYTEHVATLLSWGLAALTFAIWSFKGRQAQYKDNRVSLCRFRMVCCVCSCAFACFASSTAAAIFYAHVMEQPLSWYGSTRFAIAVFAPPGLVGVTVVLQILLPRVVDDESAVFAHDSMLFAVSIFYAVVMGTFTIVGSMISFIPMTILSTCLLAAIVVPGRFFFIGFVLIAIPSATLGAVTAYDLLCVFLPVMGRAGTAPSEVIASTLVAYVVCTYWVFPLLPIFARFPASLPRVRSYALSLSVLVACLVWILPELTLPHRDAVYSKDAPKRVAITHFHSPSQKPPTILGIVALDSIPVDINTTVRMLSITDADAIGHTPMWGMLNSTLAETTRPFQKYFGDWTVFDMANQDLDLAVPSATIVNEEFVAPDRVNLTIAVSAPGSMQVTLRVPLLQQQHGVVRAWSFDAPLVDLGDDRGCWVRHIGRGSGAERLEFSVLVERDGNTGMRPRVVFDVTSMRLGKSRSKILPRLYFPQWVSPVLVQGTGESFSL
jgi:Peptidase family M28